MRNHSLFGLFIGLVLFCNNVTLRAANEPSYFFSLPDGTVLIERPCWVRPDSVIRNDFAWKADSMHYQNTKAERTAGTSLKYKMSTKYESYMQQTALWLQDSIIGFGDDVYTCDPSSTGWSVKNCTTKVSTDYPKFYDLYTKIVALKEYHPNLYRSYFYRLRPLYYFPELTTYDLKKKGDSYPSGHGYVDWLAAMSLLYLDADSTVKIVQMGHELNWFRVLFNKHWLSDLDAGNKLASAAFPVLLRSEEYQGLLDATITEFAAKRAFPTYTDARSHMAKLPDCKKVSKAPWTTSSYEWKADSLEYTRALAVRGTERGAQALLDADYTTWLERFSAKDVMNINLANKQLFPNLQEMFAICREMAVYAADASRCHTRVAPNTYFDGGSTLSSAVSENAYMAWMVGLALTYVDTARATIIERTALDIADANYILGDYWQSEIENSEKMGSIGFAMAMRNPYFRALADAAIGELAKAKAIPAMPDSVASGQSLTDAQQAVNQVIGDYKSICDANPDTTINLYINRTFYCDGYYNTLCLPFAISASDWANADKNPLAGGTLKKFVNATIDNSVLNIEIEDASSIEAGVPYLIKFDEGEDIEKPLFCGIRVSKAQADSCQSTGMNNIGIFAPYQIPANQDYLFLGAENTFHWAAPGDDYMRGFRTYFHVNNNTTGAPMRGMKNVQLTEKKIGTGDSSISEFTNLQIYKLIDNGRVTIIRNGVRYSVDGQIR